MRTTYTILEFYYILVDTPVLSVVVTHTFIPIEGMPHHNNAQWDWTQPKWSPPVGVQELKSLPLISPTSETYKLMLIQLKFTCCAVGQFLLAKVIGVLEVIDFSNQFGIYCRWVKGCPGEILMICMGQVYGYCCQLRRSWGVWGCFHTCSLLAHFCELGWLNVLCSGNTPKETPKWTELRPSWSPWSGSYF